MTQHHDSKDSKQCGPGFELDHLGRLVIQDESVLHQINGSASGKHETKPSQSKTTASPEYWWEQLLSTLFHIDITEGHEHTADAACYMDGHCSNIAC